MGSGVSNELGNPDEERNQNADLTVTLNKNATRKKLMNLFELSDAPDAENYFSELNKSISANEVSKETETILLNALEGL